LSEIAEKKMALQSKGVRIDWRLEEDLSERYTGVASDYMSFFIDGVPVGILNGFYTDRSPFELKSNGKGYAIFNKGKHFHDATFLDRPAFFDLNTSRGTKMERLCKMVAPGFPIIYMNRGCMYWGPSQCKFCVVGYIDTEAKKDPYEVAEAVAAGVDEGSIKTHVALTSGALPNDEGLKLLGEATKAIKDAVDIPVSVNAEPPRDLKNINWLSNADSVYFNLEVYDKKKRSEILPGKSEFTLEHYNKVFSECSQYFDENQIASVLLVGLEEDPSLLKGVEHLASLGVMPVPVPFYPTFHSKLDGTSPPSAEKMKYIYDETARVLSEHGLDPFKTKAGFMRGGAIFALKEIQKGV
jgi:radical SAM protein (TIGR04043 family)